MLNAPRPFLRAVPQAFSLALLSVLALLLVVPIAPHALPAAPVGAKSAGRLSPRLALLAQAPGLSRLAQARLLSVAPDGPGSLVWNGDKMLVYIRMAVRPDNVHSLAQAGARVVHVSERYGMVTALIAPSRLEELARVGAVDFVQEALAPGRRGIMAGGYTLARARQVAPGCAPGEIVGAGVAVIHADTARGEFGVDGAGVTVGVLADSYDLETTTSVDAVNDVASGDLPGDGNPCGRTAPVHVLAEPRLGTGSDEGRAMLQVIHDIAPGANLAFVTATDGVFAFAENIRRLQREGHADVLVDDYFYIEEPFFQDGPVNVAIGDVARAGALYVTAGGNIHLQDTKGRPIGSYEAPAYRAVACPTLFDPASAKPLTPTADCHDFDPGDGVDPQLDVTLPAGGRLVLNTQWSEPWFGVSTDLDVYVVGDDDAILARAEAPLGYAPFEALSYDNDTGGEQTVRIVVARFTGRQTPRFKMTFGNAALARPGPVKVEYADQQSDDLFGPTVTDHASARDAINVGAVTASESPQVEEFSSRGPSVLYWQPAASIRPAAPLPAPEIRGKPDVMAPNGVRTTFRGRAALGEGRCNPSDPDNALCRFFGTSAAAPHVAGVLALVRQQANQAGIALSQDLAARILKGTAGPLNGTQEARGAGLVDAYAAVRAIATITNEMAPMAISMPNVVGLLEPQAQQTLLEAGIPQSQIIADYQDRAKLGEIYDRTRPYEVVSTLPAAGTPLQAGQPVVLGVRAP